MRRSIALITAVVIVMAAASKATAMAPSASASAKFAPVGVWTFGGGSVCETDTFAKGATTFSGVTNDGSDVVGTVSRTHHGKQVMMTWTTGPSAGAVFDGTKDLTDHGFTGDYLVGNTDFGANLFPKSKFRCPLYTGAPAEKSIVLGAPETDVITAVGSGHSRPLGGVEFHVCPGDANPCDPNSPSAVAIGSAPLLGSGTTSTATSPTFTPPSIGAYCFWAAYNGNGKYRGVLADSVPEQCFTVTAS